MLILAGHARARNYAANTYPFRAGSSYLYFGGPPIEGAAWLIEPGSDGQAGCTLLRPTFGFDDAVWSGESLGDDVLSAAAGVPESALALPDRLNALLSGQAAAVCPACPVSLAWMASLKILPPQPEELLAIIEIRLVKDEHELVAMRTAARVSVEGHLAAMRAARPGRREADVAAALVAAMTAGGCDVSFTPGVTVRGEVLHSNGYPNTLKSGDLLLVDAGAEEPGGYASDITRTYPVGGKFSAIQRALYETVLRAQQAAIAACVPGRRYRDVHDLAGRVICEGLVDARLLRGDPADLAARGVQTLFFTHGVGHLIGLDVHDMEDFGDLAGYGPGRARRQEFGHKFLRLDRDLRPGMTVTIEPGVYLVPALWRNAEMVTRFADAVNRPAIEQLLNSGFGGIRIEDTVCVRDANAPEVLTGALPTGADQVTAIVGSA